MKQLMEKVVVLPFSNGCSSQASIAVGTKSPLRKSKSKSASTQNITCKQEKGEECSSKGRTKNSFAGWLPLPKSNISNGIHRLIRITIKSFSQLFVYKEIEEVTAEMEIGFPTDVKHVTHIGLDSSTTTNRVRGWEDFNPPDHIIAFPSISLRQFEVTMAAHTQNAGPPLVI